MKHLLIAGFMIAALSGGTLYAKPTHPSKHASKSLKTIDNRAQKTRRQIAADLHARGSNIPPAFSADGKWSR